MSFFLISKEPVTDTCTTTQRIQNTAKAFYVKREHTFRGRNYEKNSTCLTEKSPKNYAFPSFVKVHKYLLVHHSFYLNQIGRQPVISIPDCCRNYDNDYEINSDVLWNKNIFYPTISELLEKKDFHEAYSFYKIN